MRILYLRNTGFQCDPHVGSILQLAGEKKWEVRVFDYYTEDQDEKILNEVRTFIPSHVIWLGVCGGPHESHPSTFTKIREVAKTIALIPEASHPDWGRLIDSFNDHNSFDLIVNLDGNKRWASKLEGLTTLAIFDQRPYNKPHLAWRKRPIDVGFCGGSGGEGTMRRRLIDHLKGSTKFKFAEFPFQDVPGTYYKYANFMMDCKMVVNASGSAGDSSYHVKGRVIEAGLAGCCLLEDSNSPISNWFHDWAYHSFETPEECEEIINSFLSTPSPKSAIKAAENLQNQVRQDYSPEVLWGQIFNIVK